MLACHFINECELLNTFINKISVELINICISSMGERVRKEIRIRSSSETTYHRLLWCLKYSRQNIKSVKKVLPKLTKEEIDVKYNYLCSDATKLHILHNMKITALRKSKQIFKIST